MADVKFGFERDAYNYEIVNQVKSILDFYTMAGYHFTAHDITKQVRIMLGPKTKAEHEDVRKAVHIAMSGRPRYTTEDNGKFILYKHVDSSKLQSTVMTSKGPVAQPIKTKPFVPKVLPTATIKVAPSVLNQFKTMSHIFGQLQKVVGGTPKSGMTGKCQKGLRKPDRRGSLTVPKNLIDNVGCVSHWGVVTDNRTPKTKRLIPVTSSSRIPYETTYTKDKSGNIRVTKKHLPASRTGEYLVKWSNSGEVLIQGV